MSIRLNTVQTQFTTLTNDRTVFQSEKEKSEREYQVIVQNLNHLKVQHEELLKKNRTVQEHLGTTTRKLTLLQNESKRLQRILGSERKAIEDCVSYIQKLGKIEEENNQKFIVEVGQINDEIASLLKCQVHRKVYDLISVQSVEAVLMARYNRNSKKEQEKKGSSSSSSKSTINQEYFMEKFENLKSAVENWEKEVALIHSMNENQRLHRQQGLERVLVPATNHGGGDGTTGMDEGSQDMDMDTTTNVGVEVINNDAMELFYGSGS